MRLSDDSIRSQIKSTPPPKPIPLPQKPKVNNFTVSSKGASLANAGVRVANFAVTTALTSGLGKVASIVVGGLCAAAPPIPDIKPGNYTTITTVTVDPNNPKYGKTITSTTTGPSGSALNGTMTWKNPYNDAQTQRLIDYHP